MTQTILRFRETEKRKRYGGWGLMLKDGHVTQVDKWLGKKLLRAFPDNFEQLDHMPKPPPPFKEVRAPEHEPPPQARIRQKVPPGPLEPTKLARGTSAKLEVFQREPGAHAITLFSLPRWFDHWFKSIQTNAITSWKRNCPNSQIILFGEEMGTRKTCMELECDHFAEIVVNPFGTPYIDEIFLEAQEIATSDVLCYINTDIILLGDLEHIVQHAKAKFRQFLLVARRWEIPRLKDPIDFKTDWRKKVNQRLEKKGHLLPPESGAVDCFIFTKGLYSQERFPPYLLGREVWDSWLVYDALKRNIPTIDLTPSIKIIHQDHPKVERVMPPEQIKRELQFNTKLCPGQSRAEKATYICKENKIHKKTRQN